MKNYCFIILLILSSSCSTREKRINQWKNRTSAELNSHPFFKKMDLKKTKNEQNQELWIFTEKSMGTLKRNCLRVTNQPCILYPEYRCEITFRINDNLVEDFFSRGHCPHSSNFAPK